MSRSTFWLSGALFVALSAAAQAAPSVYSAQAKALDLGSVHRFEADNAITLTLAMKPAHADEMEGLLNSIYTQNNPNYRHFLTPEQFNARFGPTQDSIQRVTRHLQAAGFKVEQKTPSHLGVTGSISAIEREFGVSLHTFEVAATRDSATYRFRSPSTAARVAPAIAGDVGAVIGLDNRPRLRPMNHRALSLPRVRAGGPAGAPNTTDPPGEWTVADLAQYYDVLPLYNHGISGKNRTIGIVTLAAFTPSDAFYYWNTVLGLNVDPNRITIVNIDGGPGAPSDASGSDETTLDVQQSGGLAPSAKIIVYQAPNTDQAFVDAFAAAISGNRADAISTSWGEWEEFLVQGTPVSDPDAAGDLSAMHNLFIQAALQGQSLSAAAGDSGGFDANEVFELPNSVTGDPGFTAVLSVDHPAADPYMLAAGGTTLPGPQTYQISDTQTLTINVPAERAWGWDYLAPLCAAIGDPDPVDCGILPSGTGGGVSIVFPVPFYQFFVNGVRTSEAGQVLADESQTPPQRLLKLPAHFPGRNLPDVSLNADPQTGYIIPYTSIVGTRHHFEIDQGGGTSFVAPQLAGITALIDQNAGGRVGLLNFAFYALALTNEAYSGRHPPLRDIRQGTNEGYQARAGYDQATGLGVLDVANLAAFFK
ncbi:MAG TPA: S53 family peptidase [Steroidobacteraceae bacterium]|jgi:subtilase family serine protease